MTTKKRIACLGPSTGVPGEPLYELMTDVGRLLATAGHEVLTGGFGGAGMEAPARGAKEAGGVAIGYTMLGRPGNEFLTNIMPCDRLYLHEDFMAGRCGSGSGSALPFPEQQYGIRLGFLLMADGFIIAGGGPGTLAELAAIVNLGAKVWQKPKRVAIVPGWGENGCEPWDSEMIGTLTRFVAIPDKVRWCIRIVASPEEAVTWATGND